MTQRTASITVTLPQRPNRAIVQEVIAQLPWRQNIALIERLGHLPAGRQERFPGDFMFQLTAADNLRYQNGTSNLRSQIVTSSWAVVVFDAIRELMKSPEPKQRRAIGFAPQRDES